MKNNHATVEDKCPHGVYGKGCATCFDDSGNKNTHTPKKDDNTVVLEALPRRTENYFETRVSSFTLKNSLDWNEGWGKEVLFAFWNEYSALTNDPKKRDQIIEKYADKVCRREREVAIDLAGKVNDCQGKYGWVVDVDEKSLVQVSTYNEAIRDAVEVILKSSYLK